uniref:SurA N-terminal domain-containing protein n=1 Tax=Otariodibacter sp. TaxID=3030919 RepID=UPI00261FEFEB
MIEKMHEKSNSFAFKVIFALVSISFVLGGIGGGFLAVDTSAVKVNGEEITQQEFNLAKGRKQAVLNEQLGEKFWDLMDKPEYAQQFHQSIMNELINDELLSQYAQSLKLGISADQIKLEIVRNPNFQKDGKFDNGLYQLLLTNNGISADQYAGIVYRGMLFSQIQEGIVNSLFDVPVQQELLGKLLLQKRKARLATYSIQDEMEKQTVSPEEMQTYYDTNKAQLVNPEQIAVDYISVTPADLAGKIQVTDDQINTYYQTNKSQYVSKGESHIAHIQVADEVTANDIEQQLKNGANFADLAKEKSIDTLSATQGGDLGWATAGMFPKEFDNAVASLNIGDISQPVKIDNAFHIIKLIDRRDNKEIPLEQVKDQITNVIKKELVATEYSNITHEMANTAFENSSSLTSVAEIAGKPLQHTELFNRHNIPEELNNEKVVKLLFDEQFKQNGQNSDPIDITEGALAKTIFVRVSQYQPQTVKTFEEAKDEITLAIKKEKAEKLLQAKSEEIIKSLVAGNKVDITFGEPKEFIFSQPDITQREVIDTIFAMPKPSDKPQYSSTTNANGDIVIIALDKVTDGQPSEYNVISSQITRANTEILQSDLLKDLRARAKIEANEDFINQLE